MSERVVDSSSVADHCMPVGAAGRRCLCIIDIALFLYAPVTAVGDQGIWTQFAKRRQKTRSQEKGMNSMIRIVAVAMLAILVGCGQGKDSPAAKSAADSAAKAMDSAADAAKSAKDAAASSVDAATDQMKSMGDASKEAMDSAADSAGDMAEDATATVNDAMDSAGEAASNAADSAAAEMQKAKDAATQKAGG